MAYDDRNNNNNNNNNDHNDNINVFYCFSKSIKLYIESETQHLTTALYKHRNYFTKVYYTENPNWNYN